MAKDLKQIKIQLIEFQEVKMEISLFPAKFQDLKEQLNLLKLDLTDNYTSRKRFNELEILVH